MQKRRAVAAVTLAFVLMAAFFVFRSPKAVAPVSGLAPTPGLKLASPSPAHARLGAQRTPSEGAARIDPARTTALPREPDGVVEWRASILAAGMLHAPDYEPVQDLTIIASVLAEYRKIFGENPEGGVNKEFTRALLGDNPKRIRFLPANSKAISPDGELLDRWGTPYFFHKLSGRLMGLRSAGPDRQFWTADDLHDEPAETPPLL